VPTTHDLAQMAHHPRNLGGVGLDCDHGPFSHQGLCDPGLRQRVGDCDPGHRALRFYHALDRVAAACVDVADSSLMAGEFDWLGHHDQVRKVDHSSAPNLGPAHLRDDVHGEVASTWGRTGAAAEMGVVPEGGLVYPMVGVYHPLEATQHGREGLMDVPGG